MSSEIKVSARLTTRNGNLEADWNPSSLAVDQSSQVACAGVQIIGTATNGEFVALGDVTAAGWAWFRNMNTTTGNYIELSGSGTGTSFVAFARMLPGEYALFPMHPTNTMAARAYSSATAALNLQYYVGSR